jgi:hypothetical protein
MTSWIKAAPQKPLESKPTLFFETNADGFCGNFIDYLYAYIYAETVQQPLYVYDRTNSIGYTYPLLLRTFEQEPKVLYTDAMVPSASSMKKRPTQLKIQECIRALPVDSLRKNAADLFVWNTNLLQRIVGLGSRRFPATFDVGVHIRAANRTGRQELPAIPIEKYVSAIKEQQKKAKKARLDVFVMTDTVSMLEDLKKAADTSWTVHHLPTNLINADMHVQARFNSAPLREKTPVYESFIAELTMIQKAAAVVCTMESSVAKFLYLTMPDTTEFVSLDKKFSAF